MFGFRLYLFPVHFSLFEVCIISVLWVIRNVYQSPGQTVMSYRSHGNWE
jgi:hypothetical protein